MLLGPHGSGKTVLLDQWIRHRHELGERTAWVDAQSPDPQRIPNCGALVIDGFDPTLPEAHTRLSALLEGAGPAARIAIATRAPLPASSAAHHRLSTASVLRLPELRFVPTELHALLAAAHASTGPETVALVEELTGGLPWLVSAVADELRLAASRGVPVPGRLQLVRALHELLDAELALPGLRESLQRLALLPAFGSHDEGALGLPGGWGIPGLTRAGWIETLPGQGGVARGRVPQGVRVALPPLDDEPALPLILSLAHERIAEDRLDEAWDIAFPRAGAELAWRIGVTAAARLNTQMLDRIARECLAQPTAWFEPCPYLGWFAAVFTRGEGPGITDRIRLIAALEPAQLAMPDPPADRLLFFAILTVAFRIQGNLERAADCADRVVSIWQGLSRTLAPRDQGVGAWGLDTAGMTYLAANRLPEARSCIRAAWEITVAAGSPPISAVFGGNLVMIQAICGDLSGAEDTLSALRRLDPDLSPRFMTAPAPLVTGMIALEAGDIDTARESLRTARALIGDSELWPVYESTAALIDTVAQTPAAADQLERALRARTAQGDRVVIPRYVRTALALMRLVDQTVTTPGPAAHPAGLADPVEPVLPALHCLLRADPAGALRLSREPALPSVPTSAYGAVELPRTEAWRTLVAAAAAIDNGAPAKETAAHLAHAALAAESTRLSLHIRFIPERLRLALAELAYAQRFPAFAELLADTRGRPSLVSELPQIQIPSQRELEVLRALAAQRTVKDVAEQLHVSINTAKTQIQRLYRKLDAHNRNEALRTAIRHGLLDHPDE